MNNQRHVHDIKHKRSSFDTKVDEISKWIEMILQNVSEINDTQQAMIDRIAGNRIGKFQESLTLLELKSSFPNDCFSDEKSDRHGTDIIATVMEHEMKISQITISVKHQKKWSSEFITQLEKNISHDGTEWGFLVTTVFPSDALNKKISTAKDSCGRLILLVKPEFASIAYYAIRVIVVYELRLLSMIKEGMCRNVLDYMKNKKDVKRNNDIVKGDLHD